MVFVFAFSQENLQKTRENDRDCKVALILQDGWTYVKVFLGFQWKYHNR